MLPLLVAWQHSLDLQHAVTPYPLLVDHERHPRDRRYFARRQKVQDRKEQ